MSQDIPKAGPALTLPHANAQALPALEQQATACKRCDLYKHATQLVFGEGRGKARVMLVGEQPGDKEDVEGRPFVGPAGQLLDECLAESGIDRSQCYVTNAVKHFKFLPRGKRRLHARPNAGEIQRCAWWLGAEIDLIKPALVVALGATALYSLLGRSVSVTKERGHVLVTSSGVQVLVTIDPSYLLRIHDKADRDRARAAFISDLARIGAYASEETAT